MEWGIVAAALASAAVTLLDNSSNENVTGEELREALNDAVKDVESTTQRQLDQMVMKELEWKLMSLTMGLQEYQVNKDPSLLEHLRLIANDMVCAYQVQGLRSPEGPGLLGHPGFMVAVGVKSKILQLLAENNQHEYPVLIAHLEYGIQHAQRMQDGWLIWNQKRFSEIERIDVPDFITEHFDEMPIAVVSYSFDGRRIAKWCYSAQEVKEFAASRIKHMEDTYKVLRDKFVDPSIQIVDKWIKFRKYIIQKKPVYMDIQQIGPLTFGEYLPHVQQASDATIKQILKGVNFGKVGPRPVPIPHQ